MKHVLPSVLALLAPALMAAETKVDFNYDIRPIISAKCYHCHGPDESSRKAKLRLDVREDTLKERDGTRAIVPGDLKASELVLRIQSQEAEEVMPPPKEGEPLTAREIDLLTRWIQEGAEYKEHWAWTAPKRTTPPTCLSPHPIDAFIDAKLDTAGLHRSPEADRATLLRRVS